MEKKKSIDIAAKRGAYMLLLRYAWNRPGRPEEHRRKKSMLEELIATKTEEQSGNVKTYQHSNTPSFLLSAQAACVGAGIVVVANRRRERTI